MVSNPGPGRAGGDEPEDAARLDILDGDWIRVTSRRGGVEARARVCDRPRPDLIFMTFHFVEALGDVLISSYVDPLTKTPDYKVGAVRVHKIAPPTLIGLRRGNSPVLTPHRAPLLRDTTKSIGGSYARVSDYGTSR
ncbi:MAG: hypothetical protein IT323_06660 [Anaerolineae bacterium]|nr:hypothetical protein [Anaerolineae bacterium]